MTRIAELLTIAALAALPASLPAAEFQLQQEEDGVTVRLDGKLLTRYVIKSGNKPILWPLIGPNGEELTRGYPMRPATPEERADHIHHRSLWFTHGDVNGVSFWDEGARAGETVHREFLRLEDGENAVIATRNDWVGQDGKRQCVDERTFRFGVEEAGVWIDMDVKLIASDGPVKFGDTKEGSGGVRVAGTMKVDAKLGGKIINSEGDTDGQAWSKRAAWCDYHGPVQGNVVGIAIMNHPKSFRFPTYWHVRTYGLFTANPFGVSDFTKAPKGAGDHTLQPGESLTLNYRILLHAGDEKQGRVAEAYARYAQTQK